MTGTGPDDAESVAYVRALGRPTAADLLERARSTGSTLVQPRCGVGGHAAMRSLLRTLEAGAAPDLLTLTIDSHTRLGHFDTALATLRSSPENLNGYPLVAHGWRRGRELTESVEAPLEIRHGSPDARRLFEVSVASGVTSFEGGGLSYNLPYCKDVPLEQSLRAWREVDARCGALAEMGLVVDRELFGTLTAVLMPPSVSLAIALLEAVAAAAEGVRCVSLAYPQGGHVVQDVAALRAARRLAERHLPPGVAVHVVLHEFMGVFPERRDHAEELIFYGALVARLAPADKLITKTHQEAHGIPDAEANVAGMRLARLAGSSLLGFLAVDEAAVAEEQAAIEREVLDIVGPILQAPDLHRAIVDAFAAGRLDVPFSASRHARSAVLPRRDPEGAIRFLDPGGLPLSEQARRRNDERLAERSAGVDDIPAITADINYFRSVLGELV